eukprot:COSAG02_NODE_158_length_32954_cov_16.416771_28_plen_91_part_00
MAPFAAVSAYKSGNRHKRMIIQNEGPPDSIPANNTNYNGVVYMSVAELEMPNFDMYSDIVLGSHTGTSLASTVFALLDRSRYAELIGEYS